MKNRIARITALALALVMLFALASCTKVDPNYSKQLLFTELTENHVAKEGYTTESYAKYNEAYMAARAVYEQGDATGLDVDRARENLIAARQALVKTADFSQLKLAIDAYKKYDPAEYTEASFDACRKAYDAAAEVYKNDTAKQSEINAAMLALQNAMEALEKIPDSASLRQMLQQHLSKSDYTAESFALYEEAYKAASDLLNAGNATKAELMLAERRLSEAMRALVFKGDISSLSAAYQRIKTTYLGLSSAGRTAEARYSKYSYSALAAVIRQVEAVLSSGEISQEEITDLITQMNQTSSQLVDLSPLLDRIDMLQEYSAQSDHYTEESYGALLSAMNNAIRLVSAVSPVTDEEISAAGLQIDTAVAALERKDLTADGQKNKRLSTKVLSVGKTSVSLQDYFKDYSAFFNDVLSANPEFVFYTDVNTAYLTVGKTEIILGDHYFKASYSGGYPVSKTDLAAASYAGINFGSSEFDVSASERLGAPTEYTKRTEISFGREKVIAVLVYENAANGIVATIEYNTTDNYITYIEITGPQPEPETPSETPGVSQGAEETPDSV